MESTVRHNDSPALGRPSRTTSRRSLPESAPRAAAFVRMSLERELSSMASQESQHVQPTLAVRGSYDVRADASGRNPNAASFAQVDA